MQCARRNRDGAPGSADRFHHHPRFQHLTQFVKENSKANSDKVLHELGQMLNEKYDLKDIVYFNKHSASLPTKPDVVQDMLNQVDILITGVGD